MSPLDPTLRARRVRRGAMTIAIVGALAVGAAGLASARGGSSTPTADSAAVLPAPTSTDDASTSTTMTAASTTSIGPSPTSTIDLPPTSIGDVTSTTAVGTAPVTTGDTLPATTTDSTIPVTTGDTLPATTTDSTIPVTTGDTLPATTTDSTAPVTTGDTLPDTTGASTDPPAPFTETYSSTAGSITVTWTGTSLALDAVSPAGGFSAEIDKVEPDRIRVEFEGEDDDVRIEVRWNDGRIDVRID